ncbi:Uncharacterized protein dnm_063720 [Desulfonema magnum]|uniref:Uncharacterized protein n=1 Tax=Desulfonema magnum TaxID=45655 RepID=A0A975GQR4_9BACT|nr:Uncharacterized protein dnm_063720 [Desulfonema magnum]
MKPNTFNYIRRVFPKNIGNFKKHRINFLKKICCPELIWPYDEVILK